MPMIETRNERDEAFGRSEASESDEEATWITCMGKVIMGFFTTSQVYTV